MWGNKKSVIQTIEKPLNRFENFELKNIICDDYCVAIKEEVSFSKQSEGSFPLERLLKDFFCHILLSKKNISR